MTTTNRNIKSFALTIANTFSKYDRLSRRYVLSLNNVPDYYLHELSSLLIQQNTSLGLEATGPDNPEYEKKMLPAMICYLSDTTSRDKEIEFNNEWKAGIANYLYNNMQELINEACDELVWRKIA